MALRAVTDHPKFARLKMLLKLGKGPTLGYLEAMWHFTGRYTAQGNIGKYSDEEIEAWVEWDGEPGALIAAFVKAGWIDGHPEHRLIVHDYHNHADDAAKLANKRAGLDFVTRPEANAPTPSLRRVDSVPTVSGLPGAGAEPGPEPGSGSEKKEKETPEREGAIFEILAELPEEYRTPEILEAAARYHRAHEQAILWGREKPIPVAENAENFALFEPYIVLEAIKVAVRGNHIPIRPEMVRPDRSKEVGKGPLAVFELLPKAAQTARLRSICERYEQSRRERQFSSWTESEIEAKAAAWAAHGPDDLVLVIEHSIQHGYPSVYLDRIARERKKAIGSSTDAIEFRKEPMRGVDYELKEDPSDLDEFQRPKFRRFDPSTGDWFDENAWRESRKVPA